MSVTYIHSEMFMYSKNPISVNGDTCFIELNNVSPSVFVTASIDDIDNIALARWRSIGDRVVTTRPEGQYEVPVPMANYLLDIPRKAAVSYRNNNKLDMRRENIGTTVVSSSAITVNGDVAYIHCFPLNDGIQVMIDSNMIEKVQGLRWNIIGKVRRAGYVLTARAFVTRNGHKASITLTKFLLGLEDTSCRVVHKNGNRLDCRLSNLVVKSRQMENK